MDVDPLENLGQSYEAIMQQGNWEVDVGDPVTFPESDPISETPPQPKRIIEAMLFVGGSPLSAERACSGIRGLSPDQFTQIIDDLTGQYRRQGRPYMVQAQGNGYVLALRPRSRPILERLYGSTREARLSTQAIDVLALVAYRQPATKQEIDGIRGAESGALLRQLIRRGLVNIVQRAETGQKEVSYGTTSRFLQLFGLSSLDDLPQTQDLQKL